MKENVPPSERLSAGTFSARILVVDDDAEIRALNSRALRHHGYIVDNAPDGEEAWQALNARNYDLLITDHTMPKVTGLELLKKVREAGMDLPVIVATGSLLVEEVTREVSLKPVALLPKPFNGLELIEAVETVLNARE